MDLMFPSKYSEAAYWQFMDMMFPGKHCITELLTDSSW
jgi:hypothetical protein